MTERLTEWAGLWAVCIDGRWLVAYKDEFDAENAWWSANHSTWCGVVGEEDRAIRLDASITLPSHANTSGG